MPDNHVFICGFPKFACCNLVVSLAVLKARFVAGVGPYVGALAGAVPAILVALTQSPALALWFALLFLCVQLLEGNLTAPLIQRNNCAGPVPTILSQTVLGTRFGILGIVVATPLTAALVTAVRTLYIENVLEQGEPAG